MNDAGKVAFTPKGVFDSAVTYEYLDTVQFGGNCYAARKTTTGNVPPTTGSYVDDNWAVLVVGGASVPIATIDVAGLVKSGNDIGVDSTGEMILKADFTAQDDLAELTGTEDRNTFFGKIAKAVSTLISHISLSATDDKAGHVKLSSSSAVTDSTGLALSAAEKNAALEGTMANQIAALNKSLTASLPFLPSSAASNGITNDALLIDPLVRDNENNKPMIVAIGTTRQMPADCTIGTKYVHWLTDDWTIVEIIGLTSDIECKIWTNVYNRSTNKWYGWSAK